MAADIIFVIMLPQLVCVLFFSFSNTYGAFAGFFTGLVLRIGAGESYLSLPCLIPFPWYSKEFGQLFPFRSFAMLSSLTAILLISKLSEWIRNRMRPTQITQATEDAVVPLKRSEIDTMFANADKLELAKDNCHITNMDNLAV